MAATVDSSDSAKRTHSNELPPNNNRETSQDLQKDKAKDTTLKDDISPESSKSEKTEAKADSTLDMHIQLESTLETSSEGARPLFSIGDPEKEPGEKSEGEKKLGPPPGTPSGKLELLPHTMTSTPVQEPTSASSRAEPLSPNLEQLSSLSLQTNPIPPAGPEEPSLFAPQSGSERGQGSDSGSRADDEAEVNTSLESQISTTTVTHESQTDLDLYDQINVPIVGYEVMEPRHKFTVFKLRVQKSKDEGWHIFRRFSDFVRLNDTLKHVFPHFRLALPPKRWIGDNFNRHFIDDRMLGLQAFLNNVVSHRDVCNSEAVRTFLCIDDPPGPHDSLEESRALCDMLEDKQYHLKQDLQSRDARIALLEEEISLYKHEVENLRRALRSERATVSHRRSSPISQPSESSLTEQDEASEAEADQMPESKASPEFISPEGIIGEEPDVSSEYSRNPLALSTTTVDNLLSFDEEIKAMEKTWEKSSRKEPRPINATKELSKEKLGADCPEVSKGLSATAVSS